MKVFIGSDHAGYQYKERLKQKLTALGVSWQDCGSHDPDSTDDYPNFAITVAKKVVAAKAKGILICGTGTGMAIAANKVKGARASFAYDKYSAQMARVDNDANILTLRSRNFSFRNIVKVVKVWLETKESKNKRHQNRIKKITEYENQKWSPGVSSQIVPSLIAHSQKELNHLFKKVQSTLYHLDVMDGLFVGDTTCDFPFRLKKGAYYEAHLMVNHPLAWMKKHITKVHSVIIHAECKDSLKKCIFYAKSQNRSVGLAIKPETEIKKIETLLPLIDFVLVMTVCPGKYGAQFVKKTVSKIRALHKRHPEMIIECDGHMNNQTIALTRNAGASRFAVGSSIMQTKNPQQAYLALQKKYN